MTIKELINTYFWMTPVLLLLNYFFLRIFDYKAKILPKEIFVSFALLPAVWVTFFAFVLTQLFSAAQASDISRASGFAFVSYILTNVFPIYVWRKPFTLRDYYRVQVKGKSVLKSKWNFVSLAIFIFLIGIHLWAISAEYTNEFSGCAILIIFYAIYIGFLSIPGVNGPHIYRGKPANEENWPDEWPDLPPEDKQ